MKNLILLFVLLVFVGSSQAQKAKPQPTKKPMSVVAETPVIEIPKKTATQKVVIEKINGDRLTGLFVSGDTDSVTIDLSGVSLPLKLDEIKAMWFGEIPQPAVVENKTDYAAEALKSLRKLTAATDVGVNFQDYSRRVIDVKAEVEDLLPKIADYYVRNEIKSAMDAYADASSAWNFAVQNRGYLYIDFEPAITLRPKYNIPTEKLGSLTLISNQTALSKIWATAKIHMDNAQRGKP